MDIMTYIDCLHIMSCHLLKEKIGFKSRALSLIKEIEILKTEDKQSYLNEKYFRTTKKKKRKKKYMTNQ